MQNRPFELACEKKQINVKSKNITYYLVSKSMYIYNVQCISSAN